MNPDQAQIQWRKSSHSAQQGDCVEVGAGIQEILVRDSKNSEGPRLTFSRREWTALVGKIKGE